MANLNLTYSGNMNITSAQLTSAGTIDVQYEPNTTGRISGWSYTPTGNLVCGETYTFYLYPQFSGTVLTENFTISGVDEAGIPRSDTAVLRQGFDTDFRNYRLFLSNFYYMNVNSTAATENYLEVNATITGWDSYHNATILIIPMKGVQLVAQWYVEDPTQPTGSVISSLEIVVADSITGTGQASAVYVSSSATVSLVYSSTDTSIATIDPDTGAITVLQDGTVTFCVQDRLSGLVDCEQVNVYLDVPPGPDTGETGGTNEFIVFYNVTSTTQPTWIASTIGGENYPYQPVEGGVQNSTLISARLEDGTNVPLIEENYCIYYTFPETGVQKIYYTSSDSRIPGGAFAFRAGYTPGPSSLALFGVNTLNMTDIGWSAFFHMDNLTSLVMPNMNYIGDEVFLGHSLTGNLVLPNTLTHIGGGAFEGGDGRLTSVTIPSSVTFIGGNGLYIAGLESMTFLGTNPPYLGYNQALGYTGYTFPIYVPCEAVYDYVSAFTQYAHRILCDGGGEPTTGLTLSVADEIVESGVAVAIYPTDVFERYPEFLSSNPDVATIDNSGNITVISNGITTICVRDMVSGLSDCKTITARRAVYISSIELHNTLVIGQEAADVTYTPSSATVSLVYSSSNPDIISVDSNGLITVNDYGTADITVRDVYTNRSDVKTITGMKAIDPEPYKSNYLTFDILTGGTVTLKSGLETGITIDVRINGGSWSTKKPKSGSNVNITVSPGDKLEFRASRSKYNHTIFASSFCRFNVSGNIMSIVNKEPSSFSARTQFDETYVFRDLFAGCAGIVDASCLAMPITGLTTGCYERMFRNCTNMKVAPMLPATRFYGTSGSTSWSYRRMFEGCSSLFYVKCLLGPYVNTGGVEDWLSGVASNGYFIKNSDGITSKLNIPSSWTVINAT